MELRGLLRKIKYLNVSDIEKVEEQIKKRKVDLNKIVVRRGDTVELSYPDDHMMAKLDGRRVQIEAVVGDKYEAILEMGKFSFPKSRVKKVIKRRRR